MNAPRELTDREIVTLAAVHVGQEFAQSLAALIEPDFSMDDAGEITASEWPYLTKTSMFLATWKPAGKFS
jgi:hypothetical protein